MESYLENSDNRIFRLEEDYIDPKCPGCHKPIEDGSMVKFSDGIWHSECFRCAKCHKLVECLTNLLLLRDGSPICEDCTYSCHACLKTIKDEAIMTGNETYHADCFRCIECRQQIENLVFIQSKKGIYCTKCHENRKLQRLKRKDEKSNPKVTCPIETVSTPTPTRPCVEDRSFSTTSILRAYTDDIPPSPVFELNEFAELNDMLVRSSEETLRPSIDIDPTPDIDHHLKQELAKTKSKLKETEDLFDKVKIKCKKAISGFQAMQESYQLEVQARKDADSKLVRLKSELNFYQQASIFNAQEFMNFIKEEIEDLNQTRADLELICFELRSERNILVSEIEHFSNDIINTNKTETYFSKLQNVYQQQLNSIQNDISHTKKSYNKLVKEREDIISEMIQLNSKNTELTQINNELSLRVLEKEQEAKALIAGLPSEDINHSRNPSIGSIEVKPEVTVAQRDSFNNSPSPKLFKFRRNQGGNSKNNTPKSSLEPVSEDNYRAKKHHFVTAKFIIPVKCEGCGEKIKRANEVKCSECGIVCHSKCIYSALQVCANKFYDPASPRYMFGEDLSKQIQTEKGKIPIIVETCVECVEARGMEYEGVYRKSGSIGQMRQIQQVFEKGEIPNLIDETRWNDICAITSLLKQYFRDLPNPLFTYELHSKFIDAIKSNHSEEKLRLITQLIQILPIENFNTLKYLMEHLDRIQKKHKTNLMTSRNLAVIFGPTLLRHPDENTDLVEMNHKIKIIEFILNHMDTLFVIETIIYRTQRD